jgi:cytochrome c
MRISAKITRLLCSAATFGALIAVPAVTTAQAVDADSAKALIKENECSKCHAVDKDKKGPSYKKIAAKYKGKPDGEDKVIKNMTTGPKVKLDDGTEEEHKVIDTKDQAAIKNVARWILAQ